MRTKPHVFNERNDKMIEAVLNAHKDSQKEVKSSLYQVLQFHVLLRTNVSVVLFFTLFLYGVISMLQVARVAEEAAGTIAKNLPPEVCLQALSPVLRDAEFPVNLAALKMTIKVQLNWSRALTRGTGYHENNEKKTSDFLCNVYDSIPK